MFDFLGRRRCAREDRSQAHQRRDEREAPQALRSVAILQACKVLGVHAWPSDIESQSSLQGLTAVGCDFAQSFHLEKPTALDTLVSGKTIKALRE